jgi:hypothetical protein
MPNRRVALTHRKQRSVLTDMLPFEVPPTFSNRGFYRFIRNNEIEIVDGKLSWISTSFAHDTAIKILFGFVNEPFLTQSEAISEWGKSKVRKSVMLAKACRMDTIPFNFRVAHKQDGRTLSVIHPRNQVDVASFYARHSALIIYYASLGEVSIRHPVAVSRFAYFKDKLHDQLRDTNPSGIEEEDREYEQLGSYFVYKKYRNIHRFFESYKYHRCEKKYDAMVQVDVTKCFDSIYTHSMPWAIFGKHQTKFNLDTSVRTFAGNFDSLMQRLNNRETNGIVIGPEFSRVFAEIILQSIDVELLRRLTKNSKLEHKIHFEIFRYVDDYFIFYNEPSTKLKVIETLQEVLATKKLAINPAKNKDYAKPIITEITIAKERVSSLLNREISPEILEIPDDDPKKSIQKHFSCSVNSNQLIVRYKIALRESDVPYGDLLNYTFAIVENKVSEVLAAFAGSDRRLRDQKSLVTALLAICEFAFFAYSASPKVNHTIRICRVVAHAVGFLNANLFPYELKHLLFKYVHDNMLHQIEKNKMGVHREVETLYLLISLSQVGREYWLPEASLVKYFLIDRDEGTKAYSRADHLSHFSITVLLSYLKDKVRYAKLRGFLEEHALEKLKFIKAHCPNDAEALMLFLDLIVCPYVSASTKSSLGAVFGLDAVGLAAVQWVNNHWFTAWGDNFDLERELDSKRSREVY